MINNTYSPSSFFWKDFLSLIKERVAPENYKTWFEPLSAVLENDLLVIFIPNEYFGKWISSHYINDIGEVATIILGNPIDIELRIEESEEILLGNQHNEPLQGNSSPFRNEIQLRPSERLEQKFKKKIDPPRLEKRYTFENYVVGPSNQFAHAGCSAVASMPAESYNPLFLYGGVGLGKTHLMHAIAWKILQKHPEDRIVYKSSEQFINEMITAVRMDRLDEFRRSYRDHCDVLMIDDIQFIAGKKMTQEEFFHTFNFLHSNKKQIVLTSDKYPKDIPDLEDRLRSRFEWGLIADIQPPELETRIAIIGRKAEKKDLKIDSDTLFFLASIIQGNIRELEGALVRLEAYSSMVGKEISVELAKIALQEIIPDQNENKSIDSIQKQVASHYGVKISELIGNKRQKHILLPRQVAMFLCRKYSQVSFPEIGEHFGGRDHSTVINSCKKIEKNLETDTSLQSDLMVIESKLKF